MSDGAGALIVLERFSDLTLERIVETVEIQTTGAPGAPGTGSSTSLTRSKTAAGSISGHRIVRAVDAFTVDYVDASIAAHGDVALGMSTQSATAGNPLNVAIDDDVVEPSWAWTPGLPVFVTGLGLLTQVAPTFPAAAFLLQVGVATSPTSMRVRLGEPAYL